MSLAGDHFIDANGIDVIVYIITTAVYDSDYDDIDWDGSTKTTLPTKMQIGNRKSEQASLEKSKEGWNHQDPLLQVFFPSNIEVNARNGWDADIVVINSTSKRYRVNRTDVDTILGYTKNKVFLESVVGDQG